MWPLHTFFNKKNFRLSLGSVIVYYMKTRLALLNKTTCANNFSLFQKQAHIEGINKCTLNTAHLSSFR